MKNMKFKAGALGFLVSTTGLLMSTASHGIGYNSSMEQPSGGREEELHAIQFTTELSDCAEDPANPGSTFCQSSFSLDSEFTAVVQVINSSPCVPIPALGGACRNLGAGAGSNTQNVPDSYAGTGGAATAGAIPTVLYTSIFLPDCPEAAAGGACFRETALGTSFFEWNFDTNEDGKIVDGYFIADSTFGATGATVGVFIFPEMIVRTYRGTASGGFPTQADRDCAADPATDYQTCWQAGGTTGPSTEQAFDYVTVPMNDLSLSKAVPVPAFAAAVLGLGLLAVTVLTGRRRQIK